MCELDNRINDDIIVDHLLTRVVGTLYTIAVTAIALTDLANLCLHI